MSFDLHHSKNVFIFGAGHGIGLSLVINLVKNFSHINVYCSYRTKEKASELFELKKKYNDRIFIFQVNPTEESELKVISDQLLKNELKFDLVINCIGMLHTAQFNPEKSIKQFSLEYSMELFKVNTMVTPLLLKYFEHLLNKNTVNVFTTLSAKVGSIDDNHLGGWYSYRASKAALNMILKTAAIEFKRKKNKCIVLAIHPGTTETELSKPFIKNTNYKIHSPDETAKNIIDNVIMNLSESDSGKFLSWDGEEIPW